MDRLGVTDVFEGIYDITAADYRPKPDPAPYKDFVQRFDIDPRRAIMVEDIARNLEPAHELGMGTVLIRTARYDETPDEEYIHNVADDLLGCCMRSWVDPRAHKPFEYPAFQCT